MEEKILVKGERFSIKKIMIILVSICLLVAISMFTYGILKNISYYENDCKSTYWEDYGNDYCDGYSSYSMLYGYKCSDCITYMRYASGLEYALDFPTEYDLYFIIPLIVSVFVIFIYLWLCKYEITITNKRVYGKTAFGKRVDLPMDSISAVASAQLFKGITIATSSGKISFLLIKNAKQIHDTLNGLLIDRQNKKTEILSAPVTTNTDNVDQIKKYKDLLDSGIITQEEFDKKKKELLGL